MVKKLVDKRLRLLLENGVSENHRSLVVLVGDRGRYQVANIHTLLSQMTTAKPSVLWCYKTELGFSSNQKKRMKQRKVKESRGRFDADSDNPFELFLSSTSVRFTYYKETSNILGSTFEMCVLQDFEALSPNVICRTVETVSGGGLVILLLKTLEEVRQLHTTALGVHASMKNGQFGDVQPRFNTRFLHSLRGCGNCLFLDDELNVLPISTTAQELAELSPSKTFIPPVPPVAVLPTRDDTKGWTHDFRRTLEALAKTQDQQKLLSGLLSALETRNLDEIVFLTAARGRGKSAALGLALAGALALRYTNIVLSAPSPDNLTTVFDFISKGLEALGLMSSKDFILVQADLSVSDSFRGERQNKSLVRLNLSVGGFRQAVQYVSPTDPHFFAQAELVVVDECAAIPLPTTRELIKNSTGMFIMSSTVCGYEGTGRGLTMKLLKDLRAKAEKGAAVGAARFVTELTLEEPIRYSQDDPIEKWLNSLLCLEVEEQKYDMGLAAPRNCVLYELNRDLLFSGDERTERCLHSVLSLFVTSHYKNSPNDLLTMADAPNHRLFVLCAPLDDTSDLDSVRPLAAVQLAFEGRINRDTSLRLLASGTMPQGDLIPWTLGQFFDEPGFGEMTGARVVRIACHPSVQSMGYGSQAVKTLSRHLTVPAESDERDSSMLLYPCEGSSVQCEYLGTSFGSTQPLVNFWARMQFESVFLSVKENEVTGSHSCIMVRALTDKLWLTSFTSEFRHRLVGSLGSKDYADLTSGLALSMLHGDVISEKPALNSTNVGEFYTYRDVHRLQKYTEMTASFASVQDLVPLTSSLFFTRRLRAELTFSQQAVLLAVGIQRRNFGQVAQEFGLTVSQCIALFQKGTAKIVAVLGDIIQEKESTEAANEAAPSTQLAGISQTDLSTTNLNQELAMAGKKEEDRHKRQKSRMVQQAKKIKR